MIFRKRFWIAAASALFVAASVHAQSWQAGASLGLVDAAEKHLRLDEFKHSDVNAWVGFQVEDHVFLRGTFGSLRVAGVNAGSSVSVGGAPSAPLPELADRINYGTVGIAYEFLEGDYASGLFAGIGGYRIDPDATDPAFEGFRDARQTVWGWHVGVDAAFRVSKRIHVIPRVTLHKIKSNVSRSLLTANIGVAYSF